MRNRTLFLSDLHLSTRHLYDDGLEWFDPERNIPRLLTTLDREVLARPDTVRAIVLLGDTFDTWLAPMDERPPTYEEMIADNAAIFERLNEALAHGVRVIFVRGNHDYDLNADAVQRACPGAEVCDEVRLGQEIYAAHGHEATMFNTTSLDPMPTGTPLGYFFARLGPHRLPGGEEIGALLQYVKKGVLWRVHRPDFLRSLLDVIFEMAGVTDAHEYVLEDGATQTVRQITHRYAMACARMPVTERLWRLFEECPRYLRGAALKEHRQRDRHVVIFGHTHHAGVHSLGGGALYANSGSWCQGACHFVEVRQHRDGHEVLLREVDAQAIPRTVAARVAERRWRPTLSIPVLRPASLTTITI